MKYAIVVCATPDWIPPAAITLLSCAKHGASEFADLILITTDSTQENHDSLEAFNKKHGTTIKLQNVARSEEAKIDTGRFTYGSLLRLKLDEYLSANYERVLYLDSDILACESCIELFKLDLEGNVFGAVEDIGFSPIVNSKNTPYLTKLGLPPHASYFNSGVLIFDWQKTIAQRLLPKCVSLLSLEKKWLWLDQDVLNIVGFNKWKHLEPKWNLDNKMSRFLRTKPNFRHFTGELKPWDCIGRIGYRHYRKYYFESLAGTSWSAFMEKKQIRFPIRPNYIELKNRLSFRKIARLRNYLAEKYHLTS